MDVYTGISGKLPFNMLIHSRRAVRAKSRREECKYMHLGNFPKHRKGARPFTPYVRAHDQRERE